MPKIEKAVVIGAGVMGSGIAAHLANAGLSVTLLDLQEATAREAIGRQLKAGGFMHPDFSARVTAGSTEDLSAAAQADWIVEAVAEVPAIKRDLFARLDKVRKKGSIVSSNTSTIPLDVLTEGASEAFAGDFLITHFFNPPRQMRLLEIVASPRTRPEIVHAMELFGEVGLGKGIVHCKDTPGFIANRIGCFWLAVSLDEALKSGATVEEVDAVIGLPLGVPPSGLFGLLDLVGLDLMPHVLDSLHRTLADSDALKAFHYDQPLIKTMIAEKRTGRKAGAGFYRQTKTAKGRLTEVVDLTSGDYRPVQKAKLECLATRDPRALMSFDDVGGRLAWAVMSQTLAYSASLAPEIADSAVEVDHAMQNGYGWKLGPFEMIDALGAEWFAGRLSAEGRDIPPFLALAAKEGGFYQTHAGRRDALRPEGGFAPAPYGELALADLRLAGKPAWENKAAALWDIGDGVACLEFRTKMNAFDADLLDALEAALDLVEKQFKGLVIGNDGPAFSAGANVKAVLAATEAGDEATVEGFVLRGQTLFRRLKFAPFPSVAAVHGMALGGGCEVALHCSAIQAHAECVMGLVEPNLGLVPGWGGTKELLLRLFADKARVRGPAATVLAAFDVIFGAKTSSSAFLARDLGFLRSSDGVTMNRELLLADAKARVLALAEGYKPPEPALLALPGASGREAIRNGIDTALLGGRLLPHDRVVGEALAGILSGGKTDVLTPIPEDLLYDFEREAFLDLIRTDATRARIRAMLETGKPIRN